MQQPTLGRIVHYRSHGTPDGQHPPHCRAAIVTETSQHQDTEGPVRISLAVLNPNGLYFNSGCPQDEEAQLGGTWHWPKHIEEH
ncbi:hypothetical protein ADL22_12190 [Streptomyces sp. NRRL F-4489]|uniref:hypothetical protein n=1 Tax=Streptomyces sp. NRRL F-4489 TaxID=1609095 RepID=UPI000748A79D|nr:hypothetical protein [Streptomyces sp. NRRL F-4489]KUL44698.1 hypothetical protein ADL22_12190 [Streptomyces sp. NRRL F-4489]